MERRWLRGIAVTCSVSLILLIGLRSIGEAQTWRWKFVTQTPNTPPIAAQSTVTVTASGLQMTYTVPVGRRDVVIESCRAALSDLSSATTVRTQGHTYLLVALKPSRAASCASGKRPAVALPTDDEPYIRVIAAAINRSCCSANRVSANVTPAPHVSSTPRATPALTPSPEPNATPVPRSSPAVPATPAALTADWVESEGLFSFVRVRNLTRAPLRLRGLEILSCRDVGLGCGPSSREFAVSAREVVTIATIASDNQRSLPAFEYRYTALQNNRLAERAGTSATAAPRRVARMSAQEIRTAEAGALGSFRSTAPTVAMVVAPARLLRRGSSRLAIGETGTALVRLMIAANGTPQEATIVSISNRRLAAAAIETAVSSTFAPATQNGKPIAAKYVATFSFDGTDPATASIPVWKRSPLPSASALPAVPNEPSVTPQPAASPGTSPPPPSAPPQPLPSASP